MNQTSIFWPVMALVGWTLAVLLLIPYQRFKAVFAGQVTAGDFKHGESSNVPLVVSIPNRTFMDLLEVPVLFYVVCLVSYVTQNITSGTIMLGWTYFGFRVAHSLVYLTYNHAVHRFLAFAASNVVLVIMWAGLLLALAK
ncbi:MAPEG family protein [Azonexus sp.]|uniref:MAPEG family protein n=1 Tax=Azonexus sp. TaxID=1872668 RepID=UPI002834E6A6|nr:MAPEG family protein [Azonexus sp.]MDR1994868.1 MAPEG family protein [Azonexus sp.]